MSVSIFSLCVFVENRYFAQNFFFTKSSYKLSVNNSRNTKNSADVYDFDLIKRFNDGDDEAFKILILRHKENVRNLIYLTLGNTDYIDDIMQEVFIKVYDNLSSFRFESKFSTWLYKITVNKCKDHLKKKYVRRVFVPIEETIRGFQTILKGEVDYLPEAAFNLVGTIDDAICKRISPRPEKY